MLNFAKFAGLHGIVLHKIVEVFPATMSLIQITGSEQTTLDSRGYHLIKKLGEGTFAKVYLGELRLNDKTPKFKLACKIIDTRLTPIKYQEKFLGRELNILAHCSHPHIIAVHSIFKRRHKYFIFMRFAERGDLYDLLRANGAVAERQARIWIRQLALALEYLHVLDIAHRDLKVENVLVTDNYNVKLSDFGFARSCVNETGENVWSETFCGSLAYVAPEILKGNPYRPKVADMWSLGVVIYTMLNKGNPFNCGDMTMLYRYQTRRQWKFRNFVANKISDDMKMLVSELLEPDVLKRISVTRVLRNPLLETTSVSPELLEAEQAALKDAYSYKHKCKSKQLGMKGEMFHDESIYVETAEGSKSMTMLHSKGDNEGVYASFEETASEKVCRIATTSIEEIPVNASVPKAATLPDVAETIPTEEHIQTD